MNLDRQLKVQSRAKSSIYSIYRTAKSCHLTSREITDRVIAVRNGLPPKAPRHIRAFLDGMREVLDSDLHANHLEFCYTVDGKMYSIRKESDREYQKFMTSEYLTKNHTKSGFYWIDTDKEYFIGTDIKK